MSTRPTPGDAGEWKPWSLLHQLWCTGWNESRNDVPQGMLENGNHGLCYTSCGALAGMKVSMSFKICFQAMSTRPTPGDAGEWKPSVRLLGPRQSSRLLVVLRYTAGPTFGPLLTTGTNNEEKKHFI